MKKIIYSICFTLVIFLMKSCTYSVNIDTKLFVSGIGIDLNDEGDFSLSFSYPDISEFSPESSKIKQGGVISGFGKTFYEAVEDIISKTNKTVDLEHVKIIVVSHKVVNDNKNFEKALDYLSHNSQISRRVYVCIGNGNSSDFMNFKSKLEEHSQIFISELLEHNSKENGINIVTLNTMLDYFSQNKRILLPIMELNEDKTDMRVIGSYVIDNFNIVGALDLKESMIINFLRGENTKILNEIQYNQDNIDFEAQSIDRNIKILDYGNVGINLNFNLKTIIKNCLDVGHDNINEKFVDEIKYILDKSIYNDCINLVDKFYKNGIDILNFEDYVYKFKFNTWKLKINERNNWMRELAVNINICNNITNIGNISF